MTRRVALITGVSGQDGAYLAHYLLELGYMVWGGVRRSASGCLWRLARLGIERDVAIIPWEATELPRIMHVLRTVRPDEIYNLAAQTFVQESFVNPLYTVGVNDLGVWNLLEAARLVLPEVRVYQASTSEMYGNVGGVLDEESPMRPVSPYGVAKLAAYHAVRTYRHAYQMFACNGILFNHESPLRGEEFVTRKIVRGVLELSRNPAFRLQLGNLNAARDWGYAGDYVRAMYAMLQRAEPDDYVIATGTTTTVRGFIELTMGAVDPTGAAREEWWSRIDSESPGDVRLSELHVLVGNAMKARRVLRWRPSVTLDELVRMMVQAESLSADAFPCTS